MNRRIALATLALMMSTMSFAYGAEPWDSLEGKYSYLTKEGKELTSCTIKKSVGKEAGPWRWTESGKTIACSQGSGQEPKGGKKTYSITFEDGPFKGTSYDIILTKDGKVKQLQEVGGGKKTYVKQ